MLPQVARWVWYIAALSEMGLVWLESQRGITSTLNIIARYVANTGVFSEMVVLH